MGFAAIYLLMSLAVWTETPFQKFDKEVRQPLLLFARTLTDRAIQAPLRLLPVFLCDY